MKHINILLILLFTGSGLSSQELPDKFFYKHFHGNINKTINISANLIKVNDTLYGNYYTWFLEHETHDHSKVISETMSLAGRMISPTEFILYNISDSSVFTGLFINGNRMEGEFAKKKRAGILPFEFYEKYPDGSMSFKVGYFQEKEKLVETSDKHTAKLRLTLLYPGSYPDQSVKDFMTEIMLGIFTGNTDKKVYTRNILKTMATAYFKQYKEANIDLLDQNRPLIWEKDKSMNIILNDNYVLTFSISDYAFTAGANGLLVNKYTVIDLIEGREMMLEDIFTENADTVITRLIDENIRQKFEIPEGQSLTKHSFFYDTIQPTKNFYLTNMRIHFYYNYYDIAPRSFGHIDVGIDFDELVKYLRHNGIMKRILNP